MRYGSHRRARRQVTSRSAERSERVCRHLGSPRCPMVFAAGRGSKAGGRRLADGRVY